MLSQGGKVHNKKILDASVERIFQRLDYDGSGSLDYEEFQLGLLEDDSVAKIFDMCMSGRVSHDELADILSDIAANRGKAETKPCARIKPEEQAQVLALVRAPSWQAQAPTDSKTVDGNLTIAPHVPPRRMSVSRVPPLPGNQKKPLGQ